MTLGIALTNEPVAKPYRSEQRHYDGCSDVCLADDQCTFATYSYQRGAWQCSHYNVATLQETAIRLPIFTGVFEKRYGRSGNTVHFFQRNRK